MSYIIHKLSAGRLGNKFFQVASVIGLASKYEREFTFPSGGWRYNDYLEHPIPLHDNAIRTYHLQEPDYHYTEEFWDVIPSIQEDVSVGTWLQSEKFFSEYREKVKEQLKFRED